MRCEPWIETGLMKCVAASADRAYMIPFFTDFLTNATVAVRKYVIVHAAVALGLAGQDYSIFLTSKKNGKFMQNARWWPWCRLQRWP